MSLSSMQASSPLAALHRPAAPPLMFERAHYATAAMADKTTAAAAGGGGGGGIGAAINPVTGQIRQKQLERAAQLFGAEVRGSSPAASLCADISQNLGIDNEASPRFLTPRRALFSSAFQGKVPISPVPIGLDSSPLMSSEGLDASLKHPKVSLLRKVDEEDSPSSSAASSTSPSLVYSDVDEDEDSMMIDSPLPVTRHASNETAALRPAEQPSLSRSRPAIFNSRNLTENLIANRIKTESRVSILKSSHLSIGECFDSPSPPPNPSIRLASPVQPPSLRLGSPIPTPSTRAQSPLPLPVLRLNSPAPSPAARLASPAPTHIRRATNPVLRARKAMRRSLSMFEHAADVVKARPEEVAVEKSAAMTAPIKAEAPDFISALPQKFALPHFASSEVSDTIPRISGDTLSEVMDGRYDDEFDNKLIIDCRFEYEFAGGHINGAINFNDKGDLSQHLFEAPPTGRTLLVFHCEFSKVRAPMMARYVRSEDRAYNADRYPFLSYPEVYILQDGYCGYFISNRQRCFPPIHIAMDDDKYRKERSQGLSRLKTRKVISRARTFAFGEHRAPAVPDAVPDLSTIRRARHSPPPDEDVKAIFTDGSKPAGSDDGAQVVAEPRYNSKVAGGGKPLLFDPPKNGIRCKAKILFGQSRSSGTLGKAGGAEDLFGEPISGGGAKTATTTAAMTTDMFGEPKAASTTDLFGEPKAAGSSISRSSSISRGSSTRDLFGEPTTSSSARGLFGEAKASSSARDLFGEPKAASTAADLFGVTTPRAAGSLGERVTFEEDDVFGLPKLSDSVTERRASGPASLIERRAGGANPLNAERRASGPSPLIERRASGANPFKADRRASGPDVLGERRSSGTDLFASQPKSRTAALFGAPKLTRAATFGEHPKSATATTLSEARSASRSSSGSSSSASLLLREPKSASAVSFGGETTSRASSRARLSEIFADSSPIANSAAAASPISPPPRLAARLDAIDMIGNSPILGERPKSKDSRRMSSY